MGGLRGSDTPLRQGLHTIEVENSPSFPGPSRFVLRTWTSFVRREEISSVTTTETEEECGDAWEVTGDNGQSGEVLRGRATGPVGHRTGAVEGGVGGRKDEGGVSTDTESEGRCGGVAGCRTVTCGGVTEERVWGLGPGSLRPSAEGSK